VNNPPLTLVLIPGLMCDEALWAHQRAALGALTERVAVADHDHADSLATMAARILQVHAGPIAVAGHSMGGRVALEVVRQGGARVRGLALLDTGYQALARAAPGRAEVRGRLDLLALAQQQGVRAMTAAWLQGMVHPSRLIEPALRAAIVDMFGRRTVAHFAAQLQALIERADALPVLSQARCPALVLCGEQDAWAPVSQHQQMAQLLADSVLTVVPQCGHMSPLERPQAVSAALASWWRRLTP